MFKYLNAYKWHGDPTDERAGERAAELTEAVADALRRVKKEHPEADSEQLIMPFKDYWVNYCLANFWFSVCGPPPVYQEQAAYDWSSIKRRMLAGLELALLQEANYAFTVAGEEGSEAGADGRPLSDALIAARQGMKIVKLEEISHRLEGLLTATAKELDPGANALVAALPVLPAPFDRWSHPPGEPEPLADLREYAPVTCAAAWRFLLELRRDLPRRDEIKHEILQIVRDREVPVPRFWQGMIWVAMVIWDWSPYQSIVDAQAAAEGMIGPDQAKANLQEHMSRLQEFLDIEADTVHSIRKATAIRNGARRR